MSDLYLGFVERTSSGKLGARIRPVAQASSDKTKWIPSTEDFPNSGVVSWWSTPPEVAKNSYWMFHVEESPTYKEDVPHYDAFRVKGDPKPAVQVLSLPEAKDDEDIRKSLVTQGIRENRFATKRVCFARPAGFYLGPIDLTFTDGLGLVDVKDLEPPLAILEPRLPSSFFTHNGFDFLPAETGFHKVGDVDFSADSTFLKRVLKDLKQAGVDSVATAKLTHRLIDTYIQSFLSKQLTPLQRHRLERLRALSKSHEGNIQAIDDSLTVLTSWEPIRLEIDSARTAAVTQALEDARNQIAELTQTRDALNADTKRLSSELTGLSNEIDTRRRESASTLDEFDDAVKKRLQSAENQAAEFLASIPLIKAALKGLSEGSPTMDVERFSPLPTEKIELIGEDDVSARIRARMTAAGLDWWCASALTATFASGFVPFVYGPQSNDYLSSISSTLCGRRHYWLPLNATQLDQKDLFDSVVTCDEGDAQSRKMTFASLLQYAAKADSLMILCFEGANLCQIDALLVPLLRRYAHLQNRLTVADGENASGISTPLGFWPSNLLLAATLIDGPLSLPLSRSVCEYAAFIPAPISFEPPLPAFPAVDAELKTTSALGTVAWSKYVREVRSLLIDPTAMKAVVWARNDRCSLTFRSRTAALAQSLQSLLPGVPPESRLLLHLAISLIPYALGSHIALDQLLADIPECAERAGHFVDSHKGIFRNFGLGSN